MPYYVCHHHKQAWETLKQLQGHINFHDKEIFTEGEVPDKEPYEEIPEGYTLTPKAYKPKAKPAPVQEVPSVTREPARPPAEVTPSVLDIEELPHEPIELFKTLLTLKGVQKVTRDRLAVEFKVNRYLWSDREEMKKLLKGAKIVNANDEWIDSFLKSYAANVVIPGQSREDTWNTFLRRDDAGGSIFPGVAGSTGTPKSMFEYMMWTREQERQDRKEWEERQDRLKAARGDSPESSPMAEMLKKQQEQIEALSRKLEEEQRQRTVEARFEKLENLIVEVAKAGKGDSQSEWLKAWMEEREKRHDESKTTLIGELQRVQTEAQDRMAGLQQSIVEEQRKLEEARLQGRREAEEAEKSMRERLKEAGWSSRDRGSEERILDIAETGIKTIGQELHETGRDLRDALKNANLPGKIGAGKKAPITPEEAAAIAEKMRLQQEIAGE